MQHTFELALPRALSGSMVMGTHPELEVDSLPRDQAIGELLGLSDEEVASYYLVSTAVLKLSMRASNCLRRCGARMLGHILGLTIDDLFRTRNMGRHSIQEVLDCVRAFLESGAAGATATSLRDMEQCPPTITDAEPVQPPMTEAVNPSDVPLERLDWRLPLYQICAAWDLPFDKHVLPVSVLNLCTRAQSRLALANVTTIDELLHTTIDQLMDLRGMGRGATSDVLRSLYSFCHPPPGAPAIDYGAVTRRAVERRLDIADREAISAFVGEFVEQDGLTMHELADAVAKRCRCTPRRAILALKEATPLVILGDQLFWAEGADAQGLIERGKIPTFSWLLEGALRNTGERCGEILALRCGLHSDPMTLREIGDRDSMSHERARQLVSRSIERLLSQGKLWDLICQPVQQALAVFGGIGRVSALGEELREQWGDRWGDVRPEGYLRLMREALPDLRIWKGPHGPMLFTEPLSPEAVLPLAERAKEYLTQIGSPVPDCDLAGRVAAWWTDLLPEHPAPMKRATECLHADHGLARHGQEWALTQWRWVAPKSVTQRIVAILQEEARPLDYAAIAQRYAQRFDEIHEQDVYRLISSRPDAFSRIAGRVYGLTAWGLTSADWLLHRIMGE